MFGMLWNVWKQDSVSITFQTSHRVTNCKPKVWMFGMFGKKNTTIGHKIKLFVMYSENEIKQLYEEYCSSEQDVLDFTNLWKLFVARGYFDRKILLIVKRVSIQHLRKLWN